MANMSLPVLTDNHNGSSITNTIMSSCKIKEWKF